MSRELVASTLILLTPRGEIFVWKVDVVLTDLKSLRNWQLQYNSVGGWRLAPDTQHIFIP